VSRMEAGAQVPSTYAGPGMLPCTCAQG
jgi:hypothetical protein